MPYDACRHLRTEPVMDTINHAVEENVAWPCRPNFTFIRGLGAPVPCI